MSAGHPERVERMECAPGEEAQVDFGRGAPVIDGEGQRRGAWVLRTVLSYSRKGYSESVYRQGAEQFIRCMENAFWSFGGVPRTVVIDNLRAAVAQADWYEPELTPKLEPALAGRRGRVAQAAEYWCGRAEQHGPHCGEWASACGLWGGPPARLWIPPLRDALRNHRTQTRRNHTA